MSVPRTMFVVALTATVGLVGASCGGAETPSDGATTAPQAHEVTTTTPTPSRGGNQEDPMKIQITINGPQFQATLSDSAAARDLVAQLPVTIDMIDHGEVEKTGPLPSRLSLDGQPDGADPDPGDVGYYAPGNDFVLYYGDQSYYPGIVVLGQLNGDAAQRIAGLEGAVTATVESLGD
ncbi:MAG: cyclophilin-like fold protein [Acidimicrobiales bacterium]